MLLPQLRRRTCATGWQPGTAPFLPHTRLVVKGAASVLSPAKAVRGHFGDHECNARFQYDSSGICTSQLTMRLSGAPERIALTSTSDLTPGKHHYGQPCRAGAGARSGQITYPSTAPRPGLVRTAGGPAAFPSGAGVCARAGKSLNL
jgi:hypothetical protein